MMFKQLSLIIDNTASNINADVVLFDALKNAAHVINTLNTYQTANAQNNICFPVFSIEAMIKIAFENVKTGTCNFDKNGTMVFDIQQTGTGNYLGNCKISLIRGSYYQLLEFLKTSNFFIKRVRVATTAASITDENWTIINTFENGQTRIELLTGTRVISPETINNAIGIFEVNKIISRFTSILVKIRAGEKKTYTVFYS